MPAIEALTLVGRLRQGLGLGTGGARRAAPQRPIARPGPTPCPTCWFECSQCLQYSSSKGANPSAASRASIGSSRLTIPASRSSLRTGGMLPAAAAPPAAAAACSMRVSTQVVGVRLARFRPTCKQSGGGWCGGGQAESPDCPHLQQPAEHCA